MTISYADFCLKKKQNFLAKRGKGVGLRLGVRTSGCSGMAYKLEFADAVDSEDLQFVSNGVTVLVDQHSLPYIDGMELDYTREGLNLSLIHISEPTRRTPISYAVFC